LESRKPIDGQLDENKILQTLNSLTDDEIKAISKLAIIADEELLKILSKFSKFQLMIDTNANIKDSECCLYLNSLRNNYANVVVKYMVSIKNLFFGLLNNKNILFHF
jgi:hypothetical protein